MDYRLSLLFFYSPSPSSPLRDYYPPHLTPNPNQPTDTKQVRGCPYITVEYYGARPTLTAPNLITVVNGLELKEVRCVASWHDEDAMTAV